MSNAFDRFVASVNAPLLTLDQYDDYALDALESISDPQEIEQVEELLLQKLQKSPNDPRTARALAIIHSQRAIEPLKKLLASYPFESEYGRVAAAEGLYRLTRDRSVIGAISGVLRKTVQWERRRDAARALQHVDAPEADEALHAAALDDPNEYVRQQAFVSLLAKHGVKPPFLWFTSRIGILWTLLTSSLRGVRAIAMEELEEILKQIDSGVSEEKLELARDADIKQPVLGRFFKSTTEGGIGGRGDVDYQAFDQLSGFERQWAEEILLLRLDKFPKFARALARIDDRRAIEPLRELLPRVGRDDSLEVAVALVKLGDKGLPLGHLIAVLQQGREDERVRAAAALGEIGSRDAQAALLGALEGSPVVRRAAGEALLRVRGIDPAPHRDLLERLQSPSAAERATATEAIKAIRN